MRYAVNLGDHAYETNADFPLEAITNHYREIKPGSLLLLSPEVTIIRMEDKKKWKFTSFEVLSFLIHFIDVDSIIGIVKPQNV